MKKMDFLFLIVIIFPFSIHAQMLDHFIIPFEKVDYFHDHRDSLKGKIYYQKPTIRIYIESPVRQIIDVQENSYEMYYPDENKVIKIKSASPVILPFFIMFMGVMNDNFDALSMGYSIKEQKFTNDTLMFIMQPPAEYDDKLGKMVIRYHNDELITLENHDANKLLLSRVDFYDYKTFQQFSYPGIIAMSNMLKQPFVEKFILGLINTSQTDLKQMENFFIPSDAEVHELDW